MHRPKHALMQCHACSTAGLLHWWGTDVHSCFTHNVSPSKGYLFVKFPSIINIIIICGKLPGICLDNIKQKTFIPSKFSRSLHANTSCFSLLSLNCIPIYYCLLPININLNSLFFTKCLTCLIVIIQNSKLLVLWMWNLMSWRFLA